MSPLFGLFEYWDRMNRNGNEDYAITTAKMKSFADQLTRLAPDSVDAMLAQARVALVLRDRPRALELFRETWDRYPGSTETGIVYGTTLYWSNRQPEGLAIVKAGVDLDPLNLEALTRLSNIEAQLGHCGEVQHIVEKALELEPGYGRVRAYLAYCLLMYGQDVTEAMHWLEQEPVGFLRRTGEAIALQRLGRQQEAEQQVELMMNDYGDSASYQYAQVYAQWGESEKALDWLQSGLDVNDPGVLNMGVDRLLDPLRREPRFRELLQQAGFAGCCDLNE
jgi:tetratricopeptide (TPR) repeat protein